MYGKTVHPLQETGFHGLQHQATVMEMRPLQIYVISHVPLFKFDESNPFPGYSGRGA